MYRVATPGLTTPHGNAGPSNLRLSGQKETIAGLNGAMVTFNPIQHHITRNSGSKRLCDGQPAGEADISVTDLDALREFRSQATLCPVCQKNSYQPTTALRIPRYRNGSHTLAHLYVVPVQYDFDGIRNCPHCRENPQERNCTAWEKARDGVRVLRQEARRIAKDVDEMTDATGGKPATLYEFVDGSVAYFALGTPSWQEADELQGGALETAMRILDERAAPGERPIGPGPQPISPEPMVSARTWGRPSSGPRRCHLSVSPRP